MMSKFWGFLKEIVSVDGKVSSKRFLAVAVFTPMFAVALFTGFDSGVLYTIAGLITLLLGITSVDNFARRK